MGIMEVRAVMLAYREKEMASSYNMYNYTITIYRLLFLCLVHPIQYYLPGYNHFSKINDLTFFFSFSGRTESFYSFDTFHVSIHDIRCPYEYTCSGDEIFLYIYDMNMSEI
jgi:hypothetical protein